MRLRRFMMLGLLALPLLITSLLLLRVDSEHPLPFMWGNQSRLPPSEVTNPGVQHGLTKAALRVVHLDLKGAPPKMSYIRQLLPLLAAEGCSALLIEYEDMFPYQGTLANISARNAYSREQILELLSWAHHLGIEVIPLVQTFGHLEFVLKLAEFRYLREHDSFPQEVCPQAPGTQVLIQEMIQQVMNIHRKSRYLHIGCDEVYHIGTCKRCARSRKSNRDLFIDHVTKVAKFVRSTYPGVTPLIWDDMMRSWEPKFWDEENELGSLVEPMVWVYYGHIPLVVPHYIWHWYSKVFPRFWVAGAFKGAELSTSVLPNFQRRYINQKSWLTFLDQTRVQVVGYVLTGWSRYDHFAVLCELLPPSIPSLMLNLILISTQENDNVVLQKWKKALKCPSQAALSITDMSNRTSLAMCEFSGFKAFLITSKYISLKYRVDRFYQAVNEQKAWMTPYNVKHNFSSPYRIIQDFFVDDGYKLIQVVRNLTIEAKVTLSEYFDDFTVDEWLEQRIDPMNEKLTYLEKAHSQLAIQREWQRRPLSSKNVPY